MTKLSNLLIKSSRGKYDKNRAIELKQLASRSVGINNSALCIQIKMTIELIELLESQIKDIEKLEEYGLMDLIDEKAVFFSGGNVLLRRRSLGGQADILYR